MVFDIDRNVDRDPLLYIKSVYSVAKNFSEKCRKFCDGLSTGYFNLKGGTRQGDPLSAYVFILSVETLFIQIIENSDIKGGRVGSEKIKMQIF